MEVTTMTRFSQCPQCQQGGIIDLKVLGMCLFCHMNIAGRAKLSMVRDRRREERGEAIQESRL